MALAKKWDRCRKFYDEYNFAKDDKNINGIMTLNLDAQDHYYTHKPLDLCPNCKDSFEKYANYIKEEGYCEVTGKNFAIRWGEFK